jgi:paired small multidrug resistance pump
MEWIFLLIAGSFEVIGLYLMKEYVLTEKKSMLLYQVLSFVGSFTFLSLALNKIPMGTAYSVWTGIGTVGGAIMGIIVYKESKDFKRLFFMGCILVGAIGLKLIEG